MNTPFFSKTCALVLTLTVFLSTLPTPSFAHENGGGCREKITKELFDVENTRDSLNSLEKSLEDSKLSTRGKYVMGVTAAGVGAIFLLGSLGGAFSDASGIPGAWKNDRRNAIIGALISGAVAFGGGYWVYVTHEQREKLKSLIKETKISLQSQEKELYEDLGACQD